MSEPTASAHNDEDPFAALKVSLPKDKKKLLRKKRKRLDLSDNNTDSSHSKDTEDDDEEEPQSVLYVVYLWLFCLLGTVQVST